MSILFYLLVAFTVMDINVIESDKGWEPLWRVYVGFVFIVFAVIDVVTIYLGAIGIAKWCKNNNT